MKTQILYIDNDIASYILVSEILGSDVEITQCRDGLIAIKLFRKFPMFDLIITETRLPGADGVIVLREIRKVTPDIPIIAQTASVLDNMKERCMDAGFDEYVSKPIDLNLFVLLASNYIHKTSLVEIKTYNSQRQL